MTQIAYPYMPAEGSIQYEAATNTYMQQAMRLARTSSLDAVMPNASVLVHNGTVIGSGANGSDYHQTHECERIRLGLPTGQGYELCEGCHPKNHSEPKAIANAQAGGHETTGAELYLWGHWWCCEPCWQAMLHAGITTVHLLERSEVLFNKAVAGNIVGRQFEAA